MHSQCWNWRGSNVKHKTVRDDAGLTYYEWLATARETADSSIRENTARSVLAYLTSSDQAALDGLHLSWRAMAHGELKAWDAANQDWTLAFEQGFGEVKTSCFLALAQLHRGDEQNYRRVCAQMVNELGATTDEDARFRFAWACAHGPLALDDLKVPLELASKLVEENPDCAAYQCTLGALLYRAGRYDEAAKRLRQATDAFVVNPSDQFSDRLPEAPHGDGPMEAWRRHRIARVVRRGPRRTTTTRSIRLVPGTVAQRWNCFGARPKP